MKQFFGILAFVAISLLGTSTLTAQQTIAHVNTDTIILRMDEYAQAASKVNAYSQQLEKKLAAERQQIIAYAQQVQAQMDLGEISDTVAAAAQQRINQMQQAFQQSAGNADRQLAQKEQELVQPVYQKFNSALKAVAKEKGYAYIVDQKMFLYLEGGIDATADVAQKLGVNLAKPLPQTQRAPAAGGQ